MNDDELITRLRLLHDGIEPPLTAPGEDAARGQRLLRRRRTTVAGVAVAAVLTGFGVVSTATDALADLTGSGSVRGPEVADDRPPATALGRSERVGINATGDPISVALPADAQGFPAPTGVASEARGTVYAGLAVFEPRFIAGGASACDSDTWGDDSVRAAESAEEVAQQLARLPQAQVLRPVTSATAHGHPAWRLEVSIGNGCLDGGGGLRIAEADPDFGLAYGRTPSDVRIVIDVLDVDGTPIVVALWHFAEASPELVARVTATRDAIVLVTGP